MCRVLFQYATCRNLQTGPDGGEGWWLESDYSVECYTDQYWTWVPVVTISALVFAFGVPALFGYLLYHYKDLGKAGDPVIQKSLGWMYEPYRDGKEWWLCVEMVRILLLSSCVGFLARSCWPVAVPR